MKNTRTLVNKVKFGTFEVVAMLTVPNPEADGEPIIVPMPVNVVAGPNHAYVSVKASNDVYRLTDAKGKRLAQGTPVPFKDEATDAAILRELTPYLGTATQAGTTRALTTVDEDYAIMQAAALRLQFDKYTPGTWSVNKQGKVTQNKIARPEPAWWPEVVANPRAAWKSAKDRIEARVMEGIA